MYEMTTDETAMLTEAGFIPVWVHIPADGE